MSQLNRRSSDNALATAIMVMMACAIGALVCLYNDTPDSYTVAGVLAVTAVIMLLVSARMA